MKRLLPLHEALAALGACAGVSEPQLTRSDVFWRLWSGGGIHRRPPGSMWRALATFSRLRAEESPALILCGLGLRFLKANSVVEPTQRARRPPVPTPQERHQ